MKVTILGAGRMGSAMALRLIDTGQEVTVWNRERERVVPLADAGATLADGIVPSVAAEMLPAMRRDAVWLQASTVGAEWADRLRQLADERGRAILDAPVSGSTGPARNGTLTWLVAGPQEAIDAARPVLDALGQHVF